MKLIGALAFLLLTSSAMAAGLRQKGVTPVSRDDGDSPIMISTTCPVGSWNVVVSSDAIRRSIKLWSAAQNTVSVCIGTMTLTADPCNDLSAGFELTPATGTLSNVELFTGIKLTCRARNSGTSNLKGMVGRDTGDYGNIGNAGW